MYDIKDMAGKEVLLKFRGSVVGVDIDRISPNNQYVFLIPNPWLGYELGWVSMSTVQVVDVLGNSLKVSNYNKRVAELASKTEIKPRLLKWLWFK